MLMLSMPILYHITYSAASVGVLPVEMRR